jgi:5'-nucleotidase
MLGALIVVFLVSTSCCTARTSGPQGAGGMNQGGNLESGETWISVMSTNDVHGYILPQTQFVKTLEGEQVDAGIGGVEWLSGYKAVIEKRDPGRVLLLDAGDMFQGTLISNNVKGASVVAAMNQLGYTAAAVGNHEFDFTTETPEDTDMFGALKARAKEAKFPFLAANIFDRATGRRIDWENFTDHVIVERGGVKIAIIGGATEDTPHVTGPHVGKLLEFKPLDEVLVPLAERMRAEGAQVVIALVHSGSRCRPGTSPDDLSSCEKDTEMFTLAKAFKPGTVDLIIGGHTHSYVSHRVNGIMLSEVWAKGRDFGLHRLKVGAAQGRVVDSRIEGPVAMCHKIPEDTDTCIGVGRRRVSSKFRPALMLGEDVHRDRFLDKILTEPMKVGLQLGKEVLGPVVKRPLRSTTYGDNPLGILIVDAMLEEFPTADIAITNGSGIRASLGTGKVTYDDLFEVLPFDSAMTMIRITGAELSDLMRIATSGAHGLPVVSGIRMVVDKAADDCIAEDWNGNGEREKFERKLLQKIELDDGTPLDPDKEYMLLTNSYLGAGGSDWSQVLAKLPQERFSSPSGEQSMRDIVAAWMRKHPVELGGDQYPLSFGMPPRVKVLHPRHVPGSTCTALLGIPLGE